MSNYQQYGDTDRLRALRKLSGQRWRISLWLTAVMMFIYFGFILLVAFNKQLMGQTIVPGLSIGILLGALTIVAAWVLIFIYMRWANTHFDDQLAEVSPLIQVDILKHTDALFPLKNPGLVTIPLSFVVGIVVSLLTPEAGAEKKFIETEHRIAGDF